MTLLRSFPVAARYFISLTVVFIALHLELGQRQAEAQVPLPADEPLQNPADPAIRRIRVWPRGEPGAVNAQWFPSANGRESIAVITGGINVLVEGLDQVGTVDISTDRVVVWVGGDKPLDLSGICLLYTSPSPRD